MWTSVLLAWFYMMLLLFNFKFHQLRKRGCIDLYRSVILYSNYSNGSHVGWFTWSKNRKIFHTKTILNFLIFVHTNIVLIIFLHTIYRYDSAHWSKKRISPYIVPLYGTPYFLVCPDLFLHISLINILLRVQKEKILLSRGKLSSHNTIFSPENDQVITKTKVTSLMSRHLKYVLNIFSFSFNGSITD